ncbi:serine/threonine-protein kinase/endoribonuclease IRE1-like [Daphnia pulicaria]|uniref:serine/threonine-protein kinase/endoribonuclease IRE1-like n=1 Tax=Daphnia pulicaria TaxID=35523 RepID=UPI001EEAF89B|nr:serine/threonine-protein kinase/endoribonuclease IRE1-like [Daphnia pulicaria]
MQYPHLKKAAASQILGRGGFGIVYEGEHNNAKVAIKRIELLRTEDHVRNPTEEERMMRCDHSNVLKVFAVDQDDDFKYIVLELCQSTLHDYIIRKYTGSTMPTELDALHQMACGLQHIHTVAGLVHRDISAQNVLIQSREGFQTVLKISDFGFCKPATERGSFSISKSGTGTTHFIAPELLIDNQLRGQRGTIACDVFSLGCVFYRFLTMGRHPFSTGDELTITLNIREGNHNLNGLIEDHFAREIIKEMIQLEPSKRPNITGVVDRLSA